jgi:flavin-dependent dehydrogenase
LLKDAKLESVEKGIIPVTYKKNLVSQNTIFVGDAAGMATNWTCMGIEPAIKYGKLAGRIAAEAILKDDLSILGAFQEAWDDDNKSTYDQFYKNSATFWNENHYFWEWIIKNDLAYLSPVQLLDRIRRNEHLMKKRQIYLRSLKYKVGILIKKDLARPQNIIIE